MIKIIFLSISMFLTGCATDIGTISVGAYYETETHDKIGVNYSRNTSTNNLVNK